LLADPPLDGLLGAQGPGFARVFSVDSGTRVFFSVNLSK
jgi:hypothetical protein